MQYILHFIFVCIYSTCICECVVYEKFTDKSSDCSLNVTSWHQGKLWTWLFVFKRIQALTFFWWSLQLGCRCPSWPCIFTPTRLKCCEIINAVSIWAVCVCVCFYFRTVKNGSAFLTEPPRCIATKLPIVALTSPSLSVLATHCNKISPSPACLNTSQKNCFQYM